ncbi:MAG: hypothetical protein M1355_02580 [Patescibacteria group bacterium]|nr:hypothetical protein [Patescibacteria group bacterium]
MTALVNSKILRIIVEGPDCSGKSTLVERLKNSLRWDSKYLRHKEGYQFTRYLKEYASQEHTVFDRGHFSEEVYSKMWRGGSPFHKKEKQILDNLVNYKRIVIFCCPTLKEIKKRYLARGFEQQISLEELKRSRELFMRYFKSIPHITYKSENYKELESLIKKIKKEVE